MNVGPVFCPALASWGRSSGGSWLGTGTRPCPVLAATLPRGSTKTLSDLTCEALRLSNCPTALGREGEVVGWSSKPYVPHQQEQPTSGGLPAAAGAGPALASGGGGAGASLSP